MTEAPHAYGGTKQEAHRLLIADRRVLRNLGAASGAARSRGIEIITQRVSGVSPSLTNPVICSFRFVRTGYLFATEAAQHVHTAVSSWPFRAAVPLRWGKPLELHHGDPQYVRPKMEAQRLPSVFLKNANAASMESLSSTAYFVFCTDDMFDSRSSFRDKKPEVGASGLLWVCLLWACVISSFSRNRTEVLKGL